MQIYILRHGQAEPQKTTDEMRNLTDKGRLEVAASLNKAGADLKSVQQIWASPLIRAQQTAEIASNYLVQQGIRVPIKMSELIVPEADPFLFFDALRDAQLASVLLVSHQPFVGQVLDLLCGRVSGFHTMNTSSLACVDCEIVAAKMGVIRWLRHVNE